MLYKNDIFLLNGARYRLLHADVESNVAWIISLEDRKAWPVCTSWVELAPLEPLSTPEAISPATSSELNPGNEARLPEVSTGRGHSTGSLIATPAMRKARDKSLELLGDLPSRVPAIFDPKQRGQLVAERERHGYARSAIYRNLRRFWQGGQTPAALLGGFNRCGRTSVSVTAGRGAKSRFGHITYQVQATDVGALTDIIERLYLRDSRHSIPSAYQRLLEQHYQTADGNGKFWIRPQGERPSLKQFEYFLRKNYPLEARLRGREGEKDFERDHRAVLDTVLSRCLGVGHQYEADASIADVYLVAARDRRRIVGKPTLYFIIDRKSRLIVGWYVGLENSSWVCTMQALLTVAADKRALCERYKVKYRPADWPAHEVFPGELIADRELLQKSSDQIADELCTRIVNLPSQRPDKKPVVETQFKLTRVRLQDGTPGFDPPENAKRRMGKHYEKDACLTLDEFSTIILEAIIEHNRRPMKDYELNFKELADEVLPTPISIWNHNIVTRAGSLTRFSEERVRLALLPRAEATVSEAGIRFGSCYYTCSEAIARGWFVAARKRRFKVMVSYDGRLVDSIYVRNPGPRKGRCEVYRCVLTPKSEKFKGLSLAEVKAYEHFRDLLTPNIDQGRVQARADFHASTQPVIDEAMRGLKRAGPKKSRTARRADTRADRQAELRQERQDHGALPHLFGSQDPQHSTDSRGNHSANISGAQTGQIVSFQAARSNVAEREKPELPPAPTYDAAHRVMSSPSSTPAAPRTLAEKARQMRERMRRG